MPRLKKRRPCAIPRCPHDAMQGSSFCEGHDKKHGNQYERDRPTATERGYNREWKKARDAYLQEHPYCVRCWEEDRKKIKATVVDHIIPHKGDYQLFWSRTNWQALCKAHHDRKTFVEERDGRN